MKHKKIIDQVAGKVKQQLEHEGPGHDWWHVFRVWNMAQRLAKKEKVDLFVVELAALLHDVADWKFHGGDEKIGPRVARKMLLAEGVDEEVVIHVCEIISTMSFKGAKVKTKMASREGMVVQDADRLDAIGAIGIARAFAYGGHKGSLMYNPDQQPVMHKTKEEYFKGSGSSVNHFYEKLLLLKYQMNTPMAKRLANERHQFMKKYLDRFFQEWAGKV